MDSLLDKKMKTAYFALLRWKITRSPYKDYTSGRISFSLSSLVSVISTRGPIKEELLCKVTTLSSIGMSQIAQGTFMQSHFVHQGSLICILTISSYVLVKVILFHLNFSLEKYTDVEITHNSIYLKQFNNTDGTEILFKIPNKILG